MEKERRIAKVYRKMRLEDQPSDFAYWQTQSYSARLAALEEIRREYHGWTYETEPRVQKICSIFKLK